MQRATSIKRKGEWDGIAIDTVVLSFDDRYRRRKAMTGIGGLSFVLDMEKTIVLGDGDALILDDGQRIAVKAAHEPLVEITCSNPEHLARIAWHLGNRHLPTQIDGNRILIREDHVIDAMVQGLGAKTRLIEAPFSPEGGAYDQETASGHDHHHGHDHSHDDGHHHHG